jgi:DNA-binding response OmpR family regulator
MSLRKPKILLVDDSSMQLDAMAFVAKYYLPGNVTTAQSPTHAYAIAKRFKPEIVITDLNLNHEVDGIKLITTLKATCPNTLFIVRTLTPKEEVVTQIDGIQIWDKSEDFETKLEGLLIAHFGEDYRETFNDSGESALR